jgi:TolB protein
MKHGLIVGLILVGLLAACGAEPAPTAGPTDVPVGMPNPASVFCEEKGYTVEIREEPGGQKGYCIFPDGSECDEWAFYRGECSAPGEGQATPAEIANPASQNCVAQGGTSSLVTREDGGQYRVCLFEDNMQCEEWALMRGQCPVGGVKITGYATTAAAYCAITGGEYAATGNSGAADEQGTCTFKDTGVVCDVWEWYNGKCQSSDVAPPTHLDPGGGAAQLVFDSTRGGGYRNLYQVYSGGEDVAPLTTGETTNIAGPYSPDGTRIAYTTYGLTSSDIAVINADPLTGTGGSGQVNLTNTSGIDEGFPDWSPDGSKIAYSTGRDGNNEIYVMNADGTNAVRLTNSPGDDFAPSWSPDGARIAFVSDRDQTAGVYDLYIMNSDGSNVKQLTNDAAIDYSPDWSPDGKTIVFRSHHDGPGDIYIINADPLTGTGGTGARNLTNNPAEDWAPTWSPDGQWIAFQTNRDGNFEIYLMMADGSALTNITNDPGDDQMPYWRP